MKNQKFNLLGWWLVLAVGVFLCPLAAGVVPSSYFMLAGWIGWAGFTGFVLAVILAVFVHNYK